MQRLFNSTKTPQGTVNELKVTETHSGRRGMYDLVHLTPNPHEVLTEGPDDKFCLWNIRTTKKEPLPIRYREIVRSPFFLPDGRMLYVESKSVTEDDFLSSQKKVYDFKSGESAATTINYEFEKITMLSPDEIVYVDAFRILLHKVSDLKKPAIELDVDFICQSVAALGKDHIVVCGWQGEVCVYQKQGANFIKVYDVTDEVSEIRKKPIDIDHGATRTLVAKTLGAQRDTLILFEVGIKQEGFISRWQWLDGKLILQAQADHTLGYRTNFYEHRDSNQFLLLDGPVMTVWNEKLQSGVVEHGQECIRDMSPLPDGRWLLLLLNWEVATAAFGPLMSREEHYALCLSLLDDAIPKFNNGPLIKIIANYVCGLADIEKTVEQENKSAEQITYRR